jgi:hypothetical protein
MYLLSLSGIFSTRMMKKWTTTTRMRTEELAVEYGLDTNLAVEYGLVDVTLEEGLGMIEFVIHQDKESKILSPNP